MKVKFIFLAGLTLLLSNFAYAGAGANVYVCINLTTTPAAPLDVTVTPGGSSSSCMYDTGKVTTFSASAAGLTCGTVGYVEAKASSTKGDFCATSASKWPVGYTIKNSAFSGGSQSQWHTSTTSNNSIDLENYATDTVVCNTKALCNGTKAEWNHGTQGPIYIIFQPQASN